MQGTVTDLSNLPPLRDSLAAHGLIANKGFGQHFLLDLNITRKIAKLADLKPDLTVIEVGPGPGGLTRALLETGARVVAVEKDVRFKPLLDDLVAASGGRLSVVFDDALKVDESRLLQDRPGAVVSNLPYNVGTALLIKWLTGPFRPDSLTLMFQREVADRITAAVNDDAYGRLAVLAAATVSARKVMDVPAQAFTPPPKVTSAVVRLIPTPSPLAPDLLESLQKITAAAFGQRRKMLRSSLKTLGGEYLCQSAGLSADRRAETVDPSEFLRLAQALRSRTP
ncbi:MAG: 16S rRNA (adenine(1518)-N(6)/adenine(1519)-N(6))-dimethyltransferase [Phenylobacterium zucineum]|nr:MAG: 16S rRNA (adenine(1518)-N(6)/adenine(1519)-N(6))-dimethyltransferase [Phenylobacterium zucineum]